MSPTCSLGGEVTRQGALGCAAGARTGLSAGPLGGAVLPMDAFPRLKRKSFGGRAHRHNYWLQRLSGQRYGSPWSQHAHARGAQAGLSPPSPPQPDRSILTQPFPTTRASTYTKMQPTESEQPAFRSSLLLMLVWAVNSIYRL